MNAVFYLGIEIGRASPDDFDGTVVSAQDGETNCEGSEDGPYNIDLNRVSTILEEAHTRFERFITRKDIHHRVNEDEVEAAEGNSVTQSHRWRHLIGLYPVQFIFIKHQHMQQVSTRVRVAPHLRTTGLQADPRSRHAILAMASIFLDDRRGYAPTPRSTFIRHIF